MDEATEVLQVVLDAVQVTIDGKPYERIIVRGVWPDGAVIPAAPDGASRNVVRVFPGRKMDIRAFLLPAARDAQP